MEAGFRCGAHGPPTGARGQQAGYPPAGRTPPATAEVVLEVVAVTAQGVEHPALRLPAGAGDRAVARGHAACPAVAVAFDLAPGVAHADRVAVDVEGVVQAVGESLVGAGLADEDGVEALAEGQLADGMAAAQVVGDQDGAEDAGLAAMLLDPALGTIALALLLAELVGESGVAGGGVLSVPNLNFTVAEQRFRQLAHNIYAFVRS